jgi:arabinan endo-1,5-alpha-L-arabinosidase
MRRVHWLRITTASFAIITLWSNSCGRDRSNPPPPPPSAGTFRNPLLIQIPAGGTVQDCPDPSIIRGQQPGDTSWYMYCTIDPLNDADKDASGNFNFHLITMHRTSDLVHGTYVGDVFSCRLSAATTAAVSLLRTLTRAVKRECRSTKVAV